MEKLATKGGIPVKQRPLPPGPQHDENKRQALIEGAGQPNLVAHARHAHAGFCTGIDRRGSKPKG